MARTPQEIFAHHAHALAARDVDELVADYTDDSVLITSSGVVRGKDGVRAAFTKLVDETPDAVFDVQTQIFEGDVLLLEWVLDSPAARTTGVDTFVFGDGMIRAQTISHSVHEKG
ncbi:MAG: nuclear transport factor 2 family protein [Mycobacterium sp.]